MSEVNFSVNNITGTPGIIADITFNKPQPFAVAVGTLFIDISLNTLERSDGASWQPISGGGGPVPGIDDVLAVGQSLTAARTITVPNLAINIQGAFDNMLILDDNSKRNAFGFTAARLLSDAFQAQVFTETGGGTQVGIMLDFSNDVYSLGVTAGNAYGNNTRITVDNFNGRIFSEYSSLSPNGLIIDFTNQTYSIGDTASVSGLNFFQADLSGVIISGKEILLQDDAGGSAGITTGTTSGTSGVYLKINVGGIQRVIELLNP